MPIFYLRIKSKRGRRSEREDSLDVPAVGGGDEAGAPSGDTITGDRTTLPPPGAGEGAGRASAAGGASLSPPERGEAKPGRGGLANAGADEEPLAPGGAGVGRWRKVSGGDSVAEPRARREIKGAGVAGAGVAGGGEAKGVT
jgi:hypothetical protein